MSSDVPLEPTQLPLEVEQLERAKGHFLCQEHPGRYCWVDPGLPKGKNHVAMDINDIMHWERERVRTVYFSASRVHIADATVSFEGQRSCR